MKFLTVYVKNLLYKAICWLVGSVALCAVTIIAIPKIMSYAPEAIYKNSVKSSNAKKNDDDCGPVNENKTARRR